MFTCPHCDAKMIAIEIRHHGVSFTMESCTPCDTRRWAVDGTPSPLPAVLRSLSDDGIPLEASVI